MPTRTALLASLALVAFGCATAPVSRPRQGNTRYAQETQGAVDGSVTVEVTNTGYGYGPVTVREDGPAGRRLYSQLETGHTACIRLTGSGVHRLYAESLGGGISGNRTYVMDVPMAERPAWAWTLNGAPGNGYQIQAKAQCGTRQGPQMASGGWQVGGSGDNTSGFTMWVCGDTVPHSWVRSDFLGTAMAAITAAHEAVHAADLAALGSCQAAEAASRDPLFHLASEARAYCASARVASVLLGGSLDGWIWRTALVLSDQRNYPTFSVTPQRAETLIRQTCGPRGTVWRPTAQPGNGQ